MLPELAGSHLEIDITAQRRKTERRRAIGHVEQQNSLVVIFRAGGKCRNIRTQRQK
jgi:uncharacterized DUF497 family protein